VLDRLTRRDLLARGAAAGAGILVGARLLGRSAGLAATRAGTDVRTFVSRPDLQPPRITVVHRGLGIADGHLFLAPSSGPGQRGVLIADNAGEPIWFHPTSPRTAMNFRVALYRGEPVLTWWEGMSEHGLGVGEHVIFDRSYREVARFPAGNELGVDLHELIVTSAGTALVAAYDIPTVDLSRLGGPKRGRVIEGVVQELDIPSARVLFEWRSLDHVALEESHTRVGARFDYFHLNSIDADASGDLLVSARNTWAVYKVSRDTGKVRWRLGGKKTDFKLGPGASFSWQHDARQHGADGCLVTLFDNADAPQEEPQSRGLAISLDTKRMTAALVHQYTHRPPVLAHALGSLQRLPNGNALVGWGTNPAFTEYSESGAVRFDAHLPHGGQNYRALRYAWQGRPGEPPRLAVRDGRLYASWNGATAVAAWQVRAGAAPSELKPAGTTPRQGFETELSASGAARYAAVTALDHAGRPLGDSATIPL
jgi:hypothetical protein